VVRRILSLGVASWTVLFGAVVGGSEVADANRLFVLEKYDDAIPIYQDVASHQNPEEAAEALFGLARAYQMRGRWKLARDTFQRLLREQPHSELAPPSMIQLGQCEIKLGNLGEALSIFKKTEEEHAGEEAAIEATYNIANLDAGFFDGDVRRARAAIKGYQRVLGSGKGKPYAIPSYFGLGQCYMLLHDYRRAIESFREVIEKGPDTVWASYARDRSLNALRAFGSARTSEMLREQRQLWADLHLSLPDFSRMNEQLAWQFGNGRPALRIYAIGFFTEQPMAGSGAEKVFYSKPTIHYKNYVFSSERGTVDKTHRSVECVGKVRCTDDLLPPTLTVTSGEVTLDLTKHIAVFLQNVKFEKRAGAVTVRQLLADELHLMLDSGKIEVPAASGK